VVSRSNALYDNTRRIRVTHRTEAPSRPLYPAFIRTRRTFDVPAPPAQPIGVGLDPAIYTGTVPRIVAHRRAAKDGRVKPGSSPAMTVGAAGGMTVGAAGAHHL